MHCIKVIKVLINFPQLHWQCIVACFKIVIKINGSKVTDVVCPFCLLFDLAGRKYH